MRKAKKIGWIIGILIIILIFFWEIIEFLISERIRKELTAQGIEVKHVSVSLSKGRIKISDLRKKEKKLQWEIDKLTISFSPLNLIKKKEIKKITVENLLISSSLSFPMPSLISLPGLGNSKEKKPIETLPPITIKILEIKKGNFSLLFDHQSLKGEFNGEIRNLGASKNADFRIEGKILPSSPFTMKGEFLTSNPKEYSKLEGEIISPPFPAGKTQDIILPTTQKLGFSGKIEKGKIMLTLKWWGKIAGIEKKLEWRLEGKLGEKGKFKFLFEKP
ncbi:hypothetical protein J7K56_04900 [Candidatus Calescamantes bacterium]|nr:hypothetical protein [Candidatus Calescamantes bacterium]